MGSGEQPQRVNLDPKKRNRRLKNWARRYNASFRKVAKKFKLSATERAKRLVVFWKSCIVARRGLAPCGTVPFTNYEETPVWHDMLEGEEVAVEKGSAMVAVNVAHAESRERSTAILTMTSDEQLPAPGPIVAFKCANTGARIAKSIREETKGSRAEKAPFFFSKSGSANAELMESLHEHRARLPGPMGRAIYAKPSRQWVVQLYDSYEGRKKFARNCLLRILAAKTLPVRIPGGLTPDIQPVDVALAKPFKDRCRELQQESEHNQIIAGASIAKTTRPELIRRIQAAASESQQAVNAAKVFKGIGAANALDGSEDGMLHSNIKDVWLQEGMPKWREEYLASHPAGTIAPEALLQAIEALYNPSLNDDEASDYEESDSDSEHSSEAGSDCDVCSGAAAQQGQPPPTTVCGVAFQEAMDLTGGAGSPRLAAALKRYVKMKQQEKAHGEKRARTNDE